MAKAPKQRRGITLDPNAQFAGGIGDPEFEVTLDDDIDSTDPGPDSDDTEPMLSGIPELLAQIRHTSGELNDELDAYRQRQAEQLRQLAQQRELIDAQAEELQRLNGRRRAGARLGVLLTLLAVTGFAATGYHAWPTLKRAAVSMERNAARLDGIEPELHTMDKRLTDYARKLTQISGEVTAVSSEVAGVRADVKLLKTDAPKPEVKPVVPVKYTTQTVQRSYSPYAPYWGGRYRTAR